MCKMVLTLLNMIRTVAHFSWPSLLSIIIIIIFLLHSRTLIGWVESIFTYIFMQIFFFYQPYESSRKQQTFITGTSILVELVHLEQWFLTFSTQFPILQLPIWIFPLLHAMLNIEFIIIISTQRVLALCYQHYSKAPQLHATQSELLD